MKTLPNLFQNLLSIHDVDALLNFVQTLTSEVIDSGIINCQFSIINCIYACRIIIEEEGFGTSLRDIQPSTESTYCRLYIFCYKIESNDIVLFLQYV